MRLFPLACLFVAMCLLIGCGGGSEDERIARDIDALKAEMQSMGTDPTQVQAKMMTVFGKMAEISKRIEALPKERQKPLLERLAGAKSP